MVFGGAVVPESEKRPEPAAKPPSPEVERVMRKIEGRISQGDILTLMALEDDVKRRKAEMKALLLEGAQVEDGACFAGIDRGTDKKPPSLTLICAVAGEDVAKKIWEARAESKYERLDYGLKKETVDKSASMLGAIESAGKAEKGG